MDTITSKMTHEWWAKSIHRLVGRRLKTIRERPPKLTQDRLAKASKLVSRSSIANIERGLQGTSLLQLYVLAQALGVQPSDLLPPREEIFGTKPDPLTSLSRRLRPEERTWVERIRRTTGKEEVDDA